jgi:hypothetical protein
LRDVRGNADSGIARRLALFAALLCLFALAGCGGGGSDDSESPDVPKRPPPFVNQGGFNGASDKLEKTFKLALWERAADPRGCYPDPATLAGQARDWEELSADVAERDESVHRQGVLYVLTGATNCNRLRMAILAPDGLYILDSDEGPVQAPGLAEKRNTGGGIRHLGPATVATESFRMKGANETQRLAVGCPPGLRPLGGGMITRPSVDSDGEGVYPHSYERLGVQGGWHVSATLIDPTPKDTTPRRVTLQTVCAGDFSSATPSPHRSVFILPGQTKSVTATCPSDQHLFSGGFQRTDFRNFGLPDGGGDYITESRAVGSQAWRVTGHAFGQFGGELTAIAYCVHYDRPLLTSVSASAPIAKGSSARVTTRPCPAGRQLTTGGFSMNGSQAGFFAEGSVNSDQSSSVTGYAYFGAVPRLTAYSYCIQPEPG